MAVAPFMLLFSQITSLYIVDQSIWFIIIASGSYILRQIGKKWFANKKYIYIYLCPSFLDVDLSYCKCPFVSVWKSLFNIYLIEQFW